MKNNVTINYSEYSSNPIAQEIEFELIKDIILKLEGKLDYEKLNILIRALSQLRNQIKERR